MIGRLTDEQLDARVASYLAYRAERVAARAATADAVTDAIARRLGLVRGRPSANMRTLRLAFVLLLLLLAVVAAAVVGSIFRERYAPDLPLVQVPLEGQPWAVAAAEGSIWVGAYGAPIVYRLDPRSGTVLDEIPVVGPICGTMRSGHGALWFSHCGPNALSRLDARTLEIDRLTGYATDRVAISEDSVWAPNDDAIERLDPVTLETEARVDIGGGALLEFGGGSVWAMATDAGRIFRIDPKANSVTAEITYETPAGDQAFPVHGAYGGGALWVVDEHALRVYRVDPATNTATPLDVELQPFTGTSFGDWYVAYGRDRVWVRTGEDTISAIDPRTLQVVESRTTPLGGGGGFFVADDALWVGNNQDGTVWGMQMP